MKTGARGGIVARGVLFRPGRSSFRQKRCPPGSHVRASLAVPMGNCLFRLFSAVLFAAAPLWAAATASRQTEVKVSSPEFEMEVNVQFYDGARQAPHFYTNSEGEG